MREEGTKTFQDSWGLPKQDKVRVATNQILPDILDILPL